MKKINYNKQGISLIVLVITIIVMIILATAVVLTLSNSGIISKANDAVTVTDLANMQDLATMLWSDAYLELKADGVVDAEDLVALRNAVEKGLENADKNYATKYNVEVTLSGVTVTVAGDTTVPTEWAKNVVAIVDEVPIPKGFVASQATGEDKKDTGLVIYEGTTAVTDANVEEARQERNQYVWVPVASEDFTTKFVRQGFGIDYDTLYDVSGININLISNKLGSQDAKYFWEMELDENNMPNATLSTESAAFMSAETLAEVQAMYASVKEYEGFYIARYEAGVDSETRTTLLTGLANVHSKMGKIPYDIIPWVSSDTITMNVDKGGAVEVARSLYPKDNTNTTGVISTLTYGVEWDRALQWMKEQNSKLDLTNSTNYGNHLDTEIVVGELNPGAQYGELNSDAFVYEEVTYTDGQSQFEKDANEIYALSTGALKKAKVNNIYDMAGNMLEWTMEGFLPECRVLRGGVCVLSGAANSVALRNGYISPAYSSYGISFRLALYIKK